MLPLLFSAWWADLDRPHRLWDQQFGMGLHPDQLVVPSLNRFYSPLAAKSALDLYYRPLTEFMLRGDVGTSTISADKDVFKVVLDVHQFAPDEITVKLVNRFVVVEAKHEEKKDEHGLISRQFVRRYYLPEQVDEDKLASNVSSDGLLTITAPLKQTDEAPNERTIKIEFTNRPAIRTNATPEESSTTTKKPDAEAESREEVTESAAEEKPEK